MELSEWNDRIFQEAVVRAGRPGDPLYFYVDEDVLSAASGGLSPDDAVQDFRAALSGRTPALRFQQAAEQCQRWVESDYEGTCPFAWALALTVLGVSLPPLGRSSNNVYGRTRDLLGLPVEGGAPDGYTRWVPELWYRWNEWLLTYGREYGDPTAHPSGTHTYQGWARSQSFIRAADKEDIRDFFEDADFPESPSPAVILNQLRAWLNAIGRHDDRLAQRVNDPGLSDEFMAFLESAWRSFSVAPSVRSSVIHAGALMLWDQDSRHLDLVIDTSSNPELVGLEAYAFSGVSYTVTAADTVFYLTDEGADAESWFHDPIHDWEVASGVVVQRRERDVHRFALHAQGWLEDTSGDLRFPMLLLMEEGRTADFETLTRDCVVSPAPIAGWTWIMLESVEALDKAELVRALGFGSAKQRRRVAQLAGGFPMRRRVYLDQGEPDLILENPPSDVQVFVDGTDVAEYLAPVEERHDADSPAAEAPRRLQIRLADLYGGPGTKRIEVRYGIETEILNLTIISPSRHTGKQTDSDMAESGQGLVRVSPNGPVGFICDLEGRTELIDAPVPQWLTEIGLAQFASSPRLLDLDDVARRATAGSGHIIIRSGALESPSWIVQPFKSAVSRRRPLPPVQAGNTSELITAFVVTDASRVSGPLAAQELKRLRELLLNQIGRRASNSTATIGHRPAERARRGDIEVGQSIEANPFNEILAWLSELESPSVSMRKFDEAWRWACARRSASKAISTADAMARLESLGHVRADRVRQRVTLVPATLTRIPSSGGTHVLVGERPDLLLNALDTGTPAWDDVSEDIDAVLQNMILQPVHNVDRSAPDTIFVRLATNSQTARGLQQLGIRYERSGTHDAVHQLTTLEARLANAKLLDRFPGSRYEVWQYRSAQEQVRGRWKAVHVLPEGEHFVRVTHGRLRRWCWYSSQSGELRSVGWVDGRWAVEQTAGSNFLVRYSADQQRLLISSSMPVDQRVQTVLSLMTGLPATPVLIEGQSPQDHRLLSKLVEFSISRGLDYGSRQQPRVPTHRYDAYDGIDETTAEIVSASLGQGGSLIPPGRQFVIRETGK